MFYTPKYCSNCSDKIERKGRKLFSSEKFCELCETSFRAQEWFPRIVLLFSLIFGGAGLFEYFQQSDKPLKMSSASAIKSGASASKAVVSSKSESDSITAQANGAASNPANSAIRIAGQNSNSPVLTQNTQLKPAVNQPNIVEAVYFCGAETKKGTPCSRRVKGGGRCWQHKGQPAMLPNEKLIAGR